MRRSGLTKTPEMPGNHYPAMSHARELPRGSHPLEHQHSIELRIKTGCRTSSPQGVIPAISAGYFALINTCDLLK